MAITIDQEQAEREGRLVYDGLRGWLEVVDRLGQLQFVHGANAEEEIGAATDVLQHVEGGPAVMFDQVPGYDPSFRVFVNGFGATPAMELYLMYHAAAAELGKRGVRIARSLVGSYVTSLDMAGCSFTVTALDEEMTRLWDAPVHTSGLRWGM